MVSTEEEMLQKNKEAVVLKANHKHQMVLNIELDRIEKCRRTYESAHHFEVMLMQARGDKISQKQAELQRTRSAEQDVRINRKTIGDKTGSNEHVLTQDIVKYNDYRMRDTMYVKRHDDNNKQRDAARSISCQGKIQSITKSSRQDPQEARQSTKSTTGQRKKHERTENQHFKSKFKSKSKPTSLTEALTEKPFSADNFHTKDQISDKKVVKFPGLIATHSPQGTATHILVENPRPEMIAKVHLFSTHAYNAKNSKKTKSGRKTAPEDDMSSFDLYRLKLQESEKRLRKSKPQLLRSISVAAGIRKDTLRSDVISSLIVDRRARSVADIQQF